nr:RING finger protein 212B-like [Lepeophtheirus salmonis]
MPLELSWTICNGCLEPIESLNHQIYLTSCFHIFCRPCLSRSKNEFCILCSTKITHAQALRQKDLEQSYVDRLENADSYLKCYIKAMSFQEKHNSDLLKHLKTKFKSLSLEMKNNNDILKKENKRLSLLKVENTKLRSKLKELGNPETKFRQEAQKMFSPIKAHSSKHNSSSPIFNSPILHKNNNSCGYPFNYSSNESIENNPFIFQNDF